MQTLPVEPIDPSSDTVASPGEGVMPDHDNPQSLEASEQL